MVAPEEDGQMETPEEETGASMRRLGVRVYREVVTPEVARVEAPTRRRERQARRREGRNRHGRRTLTKLERRSRQRQRRG